MESHQTNCRFRAIRLCCPSLTLGCKLKNLERKRAKKHKLVLAEGYSNRDQHCPMGPCGPRTTFNYVHLRHDVPLRRLLTLLWVHFLASTETIPVKVVVGNSSSRPAAYSYNQTVLVSYYYYHTSDFINLDTCAILLLTRHRASTSILWHFAFALCCHRNENRASIANPPNNAQLGGTPTISQVKLTFESLQ